MPHKKHDILKHNDANVPISKVDAEQIYLFSAQKIPFLNSGTIPIVIKSNEIDFKVSSTSYIFDENFRTLGLL